MNLLFLLLFFVQTIQASNATFDENKSLHNLKNALSLSDDISKNLYQMTNKKAIETIKASGMNPLFSTYPDLQKNLPYISLGSFPTPVQKLENLGSFLNCQNIYIKRDDLCGKKMENGTHLYGGNKVRKLEFLLAEALACNATSVLTWGGVGSNHAVATACYTQFLGLKSISMVKPQPNSRNVQKNLNLLQYFGSEIRPCPNNSMREIQTIATMIEKKYQDGVFPYFIPTGGSIPLGIIGFVNGAFELKEQINNNKIPEPDKIYIPAGSWGSAVGLLIGIKLAQLKTKLMLVAIQPENYQDQHKNYVHELFKKTNDFLCNLDKTIPKLTLSENDFFITHQWSGKQYGLYTHEGLVAKQLLKNKENINLEGTYSAKAMAAMINMLPENKNKNEATLFWLTYCSDSFENEFEKKDYPQLLPFFQSYFENPVQEFDQ